MFKLTNALLVLVLTLTIYGCSSEPKITELALTADPQVELDRVNQNIKHAEQNQVDVLSPKNFEAAKESWNKAVKARSNNSAQKDILHQIAVSQAYLDKANTVADVSHQILKGPIAARQDALTAMANLNFPKEMAIADDSFKNLTKQIENNDTSGAESKSTGIESKYRDIEINSIKKEKLGAAQATLDQAIKEGAKKLTPETLTLTEKQLAQDEATIMSDRHNTVAVNNASMNSVAAAQRLIKMVRNAKNSTAKKPEDLAKQIEKNENAALNSENELNKTEQELAKSEHKLDSVTLQNQKLESEDVLNKKFEAARAEFTKDEADVYKQGNTILLRLKGLSFENNKSVIGSKNFSLLAKVQKVVSNIGPSQITIEGHTDSVGAKSINKELSNKRAESVQSYLIANKNIAAGKISAVGLGDLKPISTNKTAIGRAQNRRVDVIIQAEPTLIK